MLGRLLKSSSFIDLIGGVATSKEDGKGVQNHIEITPTPPIHMPEDLRLLLLGCRKVEGDGRSGNGFTFRLVIAQELGRMLSRDNYQVTLDYSYLRTGTKGYESFNGSNGNSLDGIPISELKEYIFGSPLQTSERCQADKLKLIKSARIIVVTRIFYNTYLLSTNYPNQRIAICCCIPECFLTVVTECWTQITKWFDECQKILIKLLESDALLPKNLSNAASTQVETILQKFYYDLISPLHTLLDVHRLLLFPGDMIDFTTLWYKEVFNWLEVKDGYRFKFLPVLLAKIKHDSSEELIRNKCFRIIVMSGNVTVANKLIFIVSAFLKPRYEGHIQFVNGGSITPSAESTSTHTDTKYDSTITSKGWEIPRKKSSLSVLGKSSDETSFAHVFLPSSLRSTSSLQYISSSLNSQYGSYGSWFKKAVPLSHSPRVGDSPDNAFMHNRNNSASSLHQQILTTNSSNTGCPTTPTTNRWSQGSTFINEYEEYSWFGTDITYSASNIKSKMHRVNMQRNSNRVYNDKLLREKFNSICGSLSTKDFYTSSATEHHAPVLEVPINEDLRFPTQELLPPYTSYLHNLDPMFQVQACPISTSTECRILECMKNDLRDADYSKTLLVSLRSREIKEISLFKDPDTKNIIKRTTRIFQNGRQHNLTPKLNETVQFIDQQLSSFLRKWEDPDDAEDKIKMLYESFQRLVK